MANKFWRHDGSGINKVILVGNVGNAPEVRQTTEGNAIATLSLATSETWKDKQTGEKQEKSRKKPNGIALYFLGNL